jgi:hypothetical protein
MLTVDTDTRIKTDMAAKFIDEQFSKEDAQSLAVYRQYFQQIVFDEKRFELLASKYGCQLGKAVKAVDEQDLRLSSVT